MLRIVSSIWSSLVRVAARAAGDSLNPPAARRKRMRAPTVALLAASLLLGPSSPAQTDAPTLPSPADALDAFNAVQAFVREWRAPEPAALRDPPGTHGACVTLRLAGKALGSAGVMSSAGDSVALATRAALQEAAARAPVERDALREERIADLASAVTIDLQLAGRPTPLLGETFDEAAAQLSPGLEGVAARAPDGFVPVFPGEQLAANISPAQAIRAAASEAGLPLRELAELRRDHGAIVYRFPVLHAAQLEPGAGAMFLHRGGRIFPMHEMTAAVLRDTAAGVARSLMSRAWPGEEPRGMLGTYEPWVDRYDPLLASPEEQALAALALFRYAAMAGVDPAESARASRFAWRVLDDLAVIDEGEPGPLERPAAAALLVLALDAARVRPPGMSPVMDEEHPIASEARRIVTAAFDERQGWTTDADPASRAMLAHALAALAMGDDTLRPSAGAAVRALFRDAPLGALPALTPWLGWAELALAQGEAAVPAATALRELRDAVWFHQIGYADAGAEDADLLGGVVFTAARTPLPTWQLARPVALLATMFADPRLTSDDEAMGELVRLMLAMRFIRQLTVDEPLMHMFRDAERSLGGVRGAPWDQRLRVDAAAMSLLAIVETLEAGRARAAGAAVRSAEGSGGP